MKQFWERISRFRSGWGFTVVELVVVIAVVGVLAGITVVAYSGWRNSSAVNQVKNDLTQAASAMKSAVTFSDSYPVTIPSSFTASSGVSVSLYQRTATTFCIDGSMGSVNYYIDEKTSDAGPQSGTCASRTNQSSPTTPVNVAVSSVSSGLVSLTWTATAGATSYLAQCASDAGFVNGLKETTAMTNSATVTGLQSVTTHFCRVKAVNAVGSSPYSSTVNTNTTLIQPPGSFAASGITNTTMNFTWVADSAAESYTYRCATDAGYTTGLIQNSSTTTSGQLTGMTPYTAYFCQARSVSINATSSWSSSITPSTTANFGTVAAATELTEVSPGPAAGGFSWTGISCSLGTPEYRMTWVSPQSTSTGWSSATSVSAITYPQQTMSTWKVDSRCVYSTAISSVTSSSNKSFTSTGTADPVGAFGTIGWDSRWQFNVNSNTYTCTSPAVEQYQLAATLIDYTPGSWTYGWTTSLTSSVNNVNQGARMTTYFQVRCLLNGIPSTVINSSSRTDNASIDAPGSVPGWCYGSCGSPRGDSWSAVSCPTGTRAVYWSYAVGDYSNPIWGAYEAENFFGYSRGYYNTGNTMVNDYLKARCRSDFTTSSYGPQSYARY